MQNLIISKKVEFSPSRLSGLQFYLNAGKVKSANNKLDIGPNKLSGTYNGNCTIVNRLFGKALYFDGDADYYGLSVSNIHAGQYTICAWAYPKVGPSVGQDEMCMVVDVDSNTFYFMLSNRDLFGQGTGWGIGWFTSPWKGTSTADTVASQLDKWTFVTGSFDGSIFKIYKNGVLSNSNSHTISGSPSATIRVGYYKSGIPEDYNGLLDDVLFYNRALSNEEIINIYNGTKAKYGV